MLEETNNIQKASSITAPAEVSFWAKARAGLVAFWLANREPLNIWLGWRLVLLVFPTFGGLLFPPATGVGRPDPHPSLWMERLVAAWTHWDGNWYVLIAGQGYTNDNMAAFYPLYPHLLRGLAFLFTLGNLSGDALSIAGLLISSLAALAVCVLLYQLARHEYDEKLAGRAVLYLMAFPTAFFLFAVYTESLFLALAMGAFYAARRNYWFLALGLASLAILTKNQGLFLALAIFLEYLHQLYRKQIRFDWRLTYFLLPTLAFGGWLGFNQITFGNPLQFLAANQQNWGHYFAWPWEVLSHASNDFLRVLNDKNGPPTELMRQEYLNIFSLPLTVFFIGLAGFSGWLVWRGKLRPAYLLFFLGCLLQPLTSPVAGQPLLSMPRYLLVIFPAFFLLALAGQRSRFFHYTYLAFCLPLFGLLLTRFVLWYWAS